jgi:hypothetical protein
MALTVDRAFVHGYTQELYRTVAQMDSKLRSAVRVKTGIVGKTYNFERLGPSDMAVVAGRHSPVNILNPEHSRRRVTFTDREGSILLDRFDEVKMLIAPKNDYARNHAEAINRVFDDQIIDAFDGNSVSVSETDATSNVALPSAQLIADGGTGLTFEKVNQALRILNENTVPYGDRYAVVSPQGVEDLLAEPEATSTDFVRQNLTAIQQGTLNTPWMSFIWIMSTRLPVTSLVRSCFFWHKTAMGLAIAIDMETSIDQRVDLAAKPIQVSAWTSSGAVRVEEAKVVRVNILEV